jgi:anthranilate phosphoribosyltransferase
VRGTFNISTTAALIVAASGVKVVKHGNRSASSRSGSADVLEKLGVKLDLTSHHYEQCLEKANLCFMFARNHHPAMKYVGPTRTALGIPTIFNLLGPLTNPAKARHQLLGVFAPELTDRMAAVLRELGSERAWVVHAEDGLDELSTIGPSKISEVNNGTVRTWKLDPASLGMDYAKLSDLQVHTLDEAAEAIKLILSGKKGPMRDIAQLNAAAGLVIAGKCQKLSQGIEIAGVALDSGAAKRTLDILVECSQLA